MNVRLMHPDRSFDTHAALPTNAEHLTRDLGLETLWGAMGNGDSLITDVARLAILASLDTDADTILYRQHVLRDCLDNADVVRELYGIAVQAIEGRRRHYFGYLVRHPSSLLHASLDSLHQLMDSLTALRAVADTHAPRFLSRGFTSLFATLQRELSDAYLAEVRQHLTALQFRTGVRLGARLGRGNIGTGYVLRRPLDRGRSWLERLVHRPASTYTVRVDPRDEAGAAALSELRGRGINLVANAVTQSVDHVVGFFEALRAELAFYVGCLELHGALEAMGAATCFPHVAAAGTRTLHSTGLSDPCLALHLGHPPVGNDVVADGMNLVLITGANQGGKSTFLRSVGVAQLMMQCGMFVAAESFAGEQCPALFTHWRREEDASMREGKLDEELARMSAIADHVGRNTIVLFNESFAATNEREGSEIATQVVRALLEAGVKVFFVTHLYEFAHGTATAARNDVLTLRAERRADATRSFKLVPGEPLETSYGDDLYRAIFDDTGAGAIRAE